MDDAVVVPWAYLSSLPNLIYARSCGTGNLQVCTLPAATGARGDRSGPILCGADSVKRPLLIVGP